MKQSYAIVLSVSLALLTASFRLSSSFDLHEEESRREPLVERPPPSRFDGSRDHARPRDDHHPPPPPPPKGDHRLEHFDDREDTDDDDDVDDDLSSDRRPSFRKYRQMGSDVHRLLELERDSHGSDFGHYDDRDEDGRLPRTLFNRMLENRRPLEAAPRDRHLDDELELWRTGDPNSRGSKGSPDKKRGLLDELEGDGLTGPQDNGNDDRDEDDSWGRSPYDDRNRKYESGRRRQPSLSDRHRLQQKLHYGAMLRTSSGKPRPGWRTRSDFNSFEDNRKRAL